MKNKRFLACSLNIAKAVMLTTVVVRSVWAVEIPGVNTLSIETKPVNEAKQLNILTVTTALSLEESNNIIRDKQRQLMDLGVFGDHRLNPQLNFIYAADFKIESSAIHYNESPSNDTEKTTSDTSFVIRDIRPIYTNGGLMFSGLVANIKESQLSQDLANQGALALTQNYTFNKMANGKLSLSAYQSQLLGYDVFLNSDNFPQLFSESVMYQLVLSPEQNISLGATTFRLRNPNGELAYKSLFRGNDVVGMNSESSQFTHNFSGYSLLGSFVKKNIIDLDVNLQFNVEYLNNQAGVSSSNESISYQALAEWRDYLLRATAYERGRQTLPAELLKSPNKQVNVRGVSMAVGYLWSDFQFWGEYFKQSPIQQNANQSSEQIFYFKAEKSFNVL